MNSNHIIKISNQYRSITEEQKSLMGCGCRVVVSPVWWMQGRQMVSQASVTREGTGQTSTYTGLTEPSFKARWRNHDSYFNNVHLSKTEGSNHIGKFKDRNFRYSIYWNKLGRAQAFNPTTRICLLETLCSEKKAQLSIRILSFFTDQSSCVSIWD